MKFRPSSRQGLKWYNQVLLRITGQPPEVVQATQTTWVISIPGRDDDLEQALRNLRKRGRPADAITQQVVDDEVALVRQGRPTPTG